MLSPSLKFEITKTVFSQVLVKNALFTDSTDILREYEGLSNECLL